MYQSLHTTVVSSPGEKVALRIRTQEMHSVAERGIIAHWYAQKADARSEFNLRWMHTFLEDQKQIQNPEEFLDSIRTELFPFEIVVLTPKGDTVVLPHMATPLDFAYAVSSKLGHHTQAAIVNGREVPLNYRLRSGDTVMLITNPEGAPVKEWLDYVQLATTRLVIQRYLDHEDLKRKYTLGREKTARLLSQHGFSIEEIEDSAVMGAVALRGGFDSISALYCSIADGEPDLLEILSAIRDQVSRSAIGGQCFTGQSEGGDSSSSVSQNSAYTTPYLLVQNEPGGAGGNGKFAQFAIEGACCCGPLIGEPIVGIFSPSGKIMVHSADCRTVEKALPDSLKKVAWNPKFSGFKTVHVNIHTQDRIGMLKAVVETISIHDVSINQANISTSKYGEGHFELDLIISTFDQFQKMSESLRKTPGILQVTRVYKDK
jgi:GTP pyrophosphokinase